jgi:hypothetical protein
VGLGISDAKMMYLFNDPEGAAESSADAISVAVYTAFRDSVTPPSLLDVRVLMSQYTYVFHNGFLYYTSSQTRISKGTMFTADGAQWRHWSDDGYRPLDIPLPAEADPNGRFVDRGWSRLIEAIPRSAWGGQD